MKAVFWDLDDTLLDTLPARMRSLEHAYATCVGGAIDGREMWRSHRGGSLEALGQRLLGADGARFVATYRQHYYAQERRAEAYEGIVEVLDTFTDHGLRMAVVTSKISWGAIEELEQAGLLHYFQAVVGSDDTEFAKPDPAPVFEAMNRVLVDDPAEVLFIGDSPADMFAARNAGAVPVAATWATIDREMLLSASPAFVAGHPHDIPGILQQAMAVRA
jgi:HAD superfamily hydrolase (TIGR01549 family)